MGSGIKSLSYAARMTRTLMLLAIGMLPVTLVHALTCADLWRGWVYASSGVLESVPGMQETDFSDHQENLAEALQQLKRSFESEGNLSSDNDNHNIDKRMAYDAGFFHGYIHVFGLSSQHIDLPVDSGHQEWAQVVGVYLDTHRERLREFAPLCVEDALVDAYGLR